MAEAVSTAPPGWRVQVLVERGGPGAEPALTVAADQEAAAGLLPFAGLDVVGIFRLVIAEQSVEGFDDLVPDAQGTAAGGQLAQVPPVDLPALAELLSLLPGC